MTGPRPADEPGTHGSESNARGIEALGRGRVREAEAHFRRALAAAPDRPDAYIGLGRVAEAMGDPDEAVARYQAAATRFPAEPAGHLFLGRLLLARSQTAGAVRHLRWAAELRPADLHTQLLLGLAHRALGDLGAALACFERAVALDPADPQAVAEQAGILRMRGEHQAAWDLVAPRVEAGSRSPDLANIYAELAPRHGQEAEAEALLTGLVEGGRLPPVKRALLEHARGDLRDRAGDDDGAFAHHRAANDAVPARFDPAAHAAWVDRMMAAFDLGRVARLPRATNASRLPVFVVGMPRSGTTLVEQILASHPEAAGAGELPDVQLMAHGLARTLRVPDPYPECVADLDRSVLDRLAEGYLEPLRARFPGARRVTDKMPQNFLHLGLIALLFPRARIVHLVRDPLDTCVSIYFTMLSEGHPYARDLGHLGRYHRQYRRLMDHWRAVLPALGVPLLEMPYEDLVADPEGRTRALLDFVDLPWDERCLRFHETARDVGTASHEQVRKPIYAASVGRARRYARHLGPLVAALEGSGA